MTKPKYVVEILVCSYKDDTNWYGDGKVIATFQSKTEADKFANHLAIVAKDKLDMRSK